MSRRPRGELDLRELPCVMQLLREHPLEPELILIDGFVHLDADETPGLGQHLFHALGGVTPVIGLNKTSQPADRDLRGRGIASFTVGDRRLATTYGLPG